MRVFLTGATGWVGMAVTKELVEAGHQVLGLARAPEKEAALAAAGAEVQRGTIEDLALLGRCAQACDGVIHTAFIHDFSNFARSVQVDREAIEALGAALAGTGRPLIITSGTAAASIGLGRPAAEDDLGNPSSPAAARMPAEELALSFVPRGVLAMVLRLPPTVHGRGDHGFVPMLIGAAREKRSVVYAGDGSNRWAAVHRFDAARLYRLALEKGAAGARYHAAGEEGVATREIASSIARHLGLQAVSKTAEEVAAQLGFMGHIFSMDCPASSAKTRAQLGWKPQHPTLLADLDGAGYFG
jgi:nucleoside-diphosphate-sugar epimerase